jgi:hypothetical protein
MTDLAELSAVGPGRPASARLQPCQEASGGASIHAPIVPHVPSPPCALERFVIWLNRHREKRSDAAIPGR